MNKKNKKVIVAMSGGVDSSVSAALLKRKGYDVTGVFMKCWQDARGLAQTGTQTNADGVICAAEDDEMWARRAAAKIGAPFYSVDLVREYRKRVFDYFISEYRTGRTPNPDVMCNREIKFGVFYDWAINEFDADYIATGHYARMRRGRLLKGKDTNKDQSYFLWAVPREKFARVLFPVGDYLKSDVRKMAKKFGLPNAERKDSQGICFVGKVDFGVFLHQYIEDKSGKIRTTQGEVIGRHQGLHYYTIGQRQGIRIGGGPPYYVARKDYSRNVLVVARENDENLFYSELIASDLNWTTPKPKFPFSCKAKIRYRVPDQDVTIEREDQRGNLYVTFNEPQRAITAGQSIVFYNGDELIGGGVICQTSHVI